MGGASFLGLLGVPAVGYLLDPLLGGAARGGEAPWVPVGTAGALAKAASAAPQRVSFAVRKLVGYVEREVSRAAWIAAVGGELRAYDPRCTHLGCAYAWSEAAARFECPCHGGTFALDGAVVAGPPRRPLDRLPLKVEAGKVLIRP